MNVQLYRHRFDASGVRAADGTSFSVRGTTIVNVDGNKIALKAVRSFICNRLEIEEGDFRIAKLALTTTTTFEGPIVGGGTDTHGIVAEVGLTCSQNPSMPLDEATARTYGRLQKAGR